MVASRLIKKKIQIKMCGEFEGKKSKQFVAYLISKEDTARHEQIHSAPVSPIIYLVT